MLLLPPATRKFKRKLKPQGEWQKGSQDLVLIQIQTHIFNENDKGNIFSVLSIKQRQQGEERGNA